MKSKSLFQNPVSSREGRGWSETRPSDEGVSRREIREGRRATNKEHTLGDAGEKVSRPDATTQSQPSRGPRSGNKGFEGGSQLLWGLLFATLAGVVATAGWHPWTPSAPVALPVYGQVPAFVLIDEKGLPFHQTQLSGKVWIADFIFTSCAGQCPQMTEAMRLLQRRLPSEVRFLSITVDPTRDTPTVLHQYAKNVGADPNRWRFLTGESASIEQLAKEGFRLSYAEGVDPKEPIAHSVRLVLVDRQGTIRGYYDGTDPKAVQQLLRDAKGTLKGSDPRLFKRKGSDPF